MERESAPEQASVSLHGYVGEGEEEYPYMVIWGGGEGVSLYGYIGEEGARANDMHPYIVICHCLQ